MVGWLFVAIAVLLALFHSAWWWGQKRCQDDFVDGSRKDSQPLFFLALWDVRAGCDSSGAPSLDVCSVLDAPPAAFRAAFLESHAQIVTALRAMADIVDPIWQGKPRGNAAQAHG